MYSQVSLRVMLRLIRVDTLRRVHNVGFRVIRHICHKYLQPVFPGAHNYVRSQQMNITTYPIARYSFSMDSFEMKSELI